MGRFTDVLRGPQLQQQYVQYTQWLNLAPDRRQAEYQRVRGGTIANPVPRARHVYADAWIIPFNTTRVDFFLRTKALGTPQTSGGTNQGPAGDDVPAERARLLSVAGSNNFTDYTAPAASSVVVSIPKFKFARLVVKKRMATATTNTTSRMTGRSYKKHPTLSASQPFGAAPSLRGFNQVAQAIRAQAEFASWVSTEGNTITIIPERSLIS